MKKILTFFALLTGLISSGQVYQKYPQYGGEWNRLWIKSNLTIPNDTLTPPSTGPDDFKLKPGLASKDDVLYYWSVAAQKYISLGTGLLSAVYADYGLSQVNDSTLKLDSAVVSNYYLRRKDSATASFLDGYLTRSSGVTYGQNFFNTNLRATGTRTHSFANNALTLDSLGVVKFRSLSSTGFLLSATNGTDSAWIEISRGVPASGKKIIAWAKHSTSAISYMSVTGLGFITSAQNPGTGQNSSISTTSGAVSMSVFDVTTNSLGIGRDTTTFSNTSAIAGIKSSPNMIKRNASADLKLLKIDTTNGTWHYYDDLSGGAYVPMSRTITINGITYDLTADVTFFVEPDSTLYTANGTITYARRINADNFPITFDSAGLFRIRDTSISSTGQIYGHIYDFNEGIDFIDYDSLYTVGIKSNSISGIELYLKDRNNFDTSTVLKLNENGVGIGTISPTTQLHVNGTVRIVDGTEQNGYVLTSDANGVASWQPISGIESTYTPTLTNTTNISGSTAYATYYKRLGNVVHVWGDVSIDATVPVTISEMGLSLPVASALVSSYDLAGTASFEDNTSVQIKGDVANGRAVFKFTPQTATDNRYSFHFTYYVLVP